jgi:hypothetical protein
MKHVKEVNEIDEIVGSPIFQIEFDSGFKDDDNKKPLNKPLTLDEV